jgi:hypothetical protein
MFAPLKPIFDWLGEKLRGVWQWFKDLIAPVKATQETLDSCKNVGVMFGQALADALMAAECFNKLRSGVDWVLEKLGIINKESDSLTRLPPKPTPPRRVILYSGNQHLWRLSGLSASYRTGGRSTLTRAKRIQHHMPGGAPGHQLDRQLRDTLEKLTRKACASARQHDATTKENKR